MIMNDISTAKGFSVDPTQHHQRQYNYDHHLSRIKHIHSRPIRSRNVAEKQQLISEVASKSKETNRRFKNQEFAHSVSVENARLAKKLASISSAASQKDSLALSKVKVSLPRKSAPFETLEIKVEPQEG